MKTISLGQVVLRCRDFSAMRDFYVNKLHLREKHHQDGADGGARLSCLQAGKGQYLVLLSEQYAGDNAFLSHSHVHFCLEVENFAKELQSLAAQGLPLHAGPEDALIKPPYGEGQAGMCGSLCAFVKDPEGNWIEIMQFTPGSMQLLCV